MEEFTTKQKLDCCNSLIAALKDERKGDENPLTSHCINGELFGTQGLCELYQIIDDNNDMDSMERDFPELYHEIKIRLKRRGSSTFAWKSTGKMSYTVRTTFLNKFKKQFEV